MSRKVRQHRDASKANGSPFKPRPYQQAVIDQLDNYQHDQPVQLIRPHGGRIQFIGVDMGEPGGDHSVITRAKVNGKGQITKIIFDEYADWPDYKWWRNPVKWLRFRKLMKMLDNRSTKVIQSKHERK